MNGVFARSCVAALVFIVIHVFVSTAVDGDVPTSADVAACNVEAQDAVRPGSAGRGNAVPNAGDLSRAAQARQIDMGSNKAPDMTSSPDAQLAGMDVEGAKDPVYQAAFRGCMRRKGF
jgi:hypothetical protein